MKKNLTHEGIEKLVHSYTVEGVSLFDVYLENGALKIYPINGARNQLVDKGIEIKNLNFNKHGAPVCTLES